MNRLLNVFRQQQSNSSQTPPEEKKQDFVGVLHIVIEETVMAVAQWLIRFIHQVLDGKIAPPQPPIQPPPSDASTGTEELNLKAVLLLEQLYDRTSSILTLEQRLSAVEAALIQASSQAASSEESSEEGSVTVKTLLEAMNSLFQQFQQEDRRMSMLEQRITRLEALLTKHNAVSKLLEQHHHAIATLQSRITDLESSPQNDNHQPILQLSKFGN